MKIHDKCFGVYKPSIMAPTIANIGTLLLYDASRSKAMVGFEQRRTKWGTIERGDGGVFGVMGHGDKGNGGR